MSTAYQNLTPAQLREEYTAVKAQFDALKAKELKLNMARGKPGREQLDLVSGILSILKTPEDCISGGVDARNYGELSGLKEAKEYWADVLGCKSEECFIGGNASLTLMYDLVSKGLYARSCTLGKSRGAGWIPSSGSARRPATTAILKSPNRSALNSLQFP